MLHCPLPAAAVALLLTSDAEAGAGAFRSKAGNITVQEARNILNIEAAEVTPEVVKKVASLTCSVWR